MVLGFRGLRSLILATSTAKFLQRDFSCYGHDDKGLWKHAACVAAGARTLAQRCNLGAESAEQMFVAGLLHDIGKLLLVPYLSGQGVDPRAHPDTAEMEPEHDRCRPLRSRALVTAKWNLNESCRR